MLMLISMNASAKHYRIYNYNGSKCEMISYNDNLELDGTCKTWNNNVLISISHYKNGIKTRTWKVYYRNGGLEYKIKYRNGVKTGTWKHYDEHGVVIEEKQYQ